MSDVDTPIHAHTRKSIYQHIVNKQHSNALSLTFASPSRQQIADLRPDFAEQIAAPPPQPPRGLNHNYSACNTNRNTFWALVAFWRQHSRATRPPPHTFRTHGLSTCEPVENDNFIRTDGRRPKTYATCAHEACATFVHVIFARAAACCQQNDSNSC